MIPNFNLQARCEQERDANCDAINAAHTVFQQQLASLQGQDTALIVRTAALELAVIIAQANIITLQAGITVAQGNIVALQAAVVVIQGNIVTINATLPTLTLVDPADVFVNGKLTYTGTKWISGFKDDFNNSSIDPIWTTSTPAGITLAEDATKLRGTATGTANIGTATRTDVLQASCVEVVAYLACVAAANSIMIMKLATTIAGGSRSIAAGFQRDGGGTWLGYISDAAGSATTAIGGISSGWVRIVHNFRACLLGWSTNASNDRPDAGDWTYAYYRDLGSWLFLPSTLQLFFQNTAAGNITSVDFSSLRVTYI